MKAWVDFYDYYLRDLPGCTYFAAANEIRKAAQEFCKRTKAWRVQLDPVTTGAGVTLYDFPLDSDREAYQILTATLDGQPIRPINEDEAAAGYVGVLQLSSREFQLFPEPAGGQVLKLKAAMFPSNAAAGLDDALFAEHAEAIAFGAKARLKKTAGMPYTDVQGALLDEERFNTEIDRVQMRAATGMGRAPLRTRARFL